MGGMGIHPYLRRAIPLLQTSSEQLQAYRSPFYDSAAKFLSTLAPGFEVVKIYVLLNIFLSLGFEVLAIPADVADSSSL